MTTRVQNTGVRRFTHWPDKRVIHALANLEKMVKAFNRCGSEDDSYSQISKLSDDVCEASTEILTAFSEWAKTHLSPCRNNKAHIDRMETKWSNIYRTALGCDLGSVTDLSVIATNPNTHPFCEKLNGWTADCSSEQCYPYVHEYKQGPYSYLDDLIWQESSESFKCEFTVSTVCDPNYTDSYGSDCTYYETFGENCKFLTNQEMIRYGVLTAGGYKTGLNCPGCGCGGNGPINLNDREDL